MLEVNYMDGNIAVCNQREQLKFHSVLAFFRPFEDSYTLQFLGKMILRMKFSREHSRVGCLGDLMFLSVDFQNFSISESSGRRIFRSEKL